jgi:hypothetical protein
MSALDYEFALRFCIWTSTLGAAIIFGHWAHLLRNGTMGDLKTWAFIPLVSESIKHLGWSLHQYWWNQSWMLFNSDKDAWKAFQSYKPIVFVSELVILLSMIGVLSPYLIMRCGKFWWLAGAGIIAALYGVGLAIGFPK